jgi:hypothetical protein
MAAIPVRPVDVLNRSLPVLQQATTPSEIERAVAGARSNYELLRRMGATAEAEQLQQAAMDAMLRHPEGQLAQQVMEGMSQVMQGLLPPTQSPLDQIRPRPLSPLPSSQTQRDAQDAALLQLRQQQQQQQQQVPAGEGSGAMPPRGMPALVWAGAGAGLGYLVGKSTTAAVAGGLAGGVASYIRDSSRHEQYLRELEEQRQAVEEAQAQVPTGGAPSTPSQPIILGGLQSTMGPQSVRLTEAQIRMDNIRRMLIRVAREMGIPERWAVDGPTRTNPFDKASAMARLNAFLAPFNIVPTQAELEEASPPVRSGSLWQFPAGHIQEDVERGGPAVIAPVTGGSSATWEAMDPISRARSLSGQLTPDVTGVDARGRVTGRRMLPGEAEFVATNPSADALNKWIVDHGGTPNWTVVVPGMEGVGLVPIGGSIGGAGMRPPTLRSVIVPAAVGAVAGHLLKKGTTGLVGGAVIGAGISMIMQQRRYDEYQQTLLAEQNARDAVRAQAREHAEADRARWESGDRAVE